MINIVDISGYFVHATVKTILQSSRETRIEVPYQCQSGLSGTYRCKLVSRNIDYNTERSHINFYIIIVM